MSNYELNWRDQTILLQKFLELHSDLNLTLLPSGKGGSFRCYHLDYGIVEFRCHSGLYWSFHLEQGSSETLAHSWNLDYLFYQDVSNLLIESHSSFAPITGVDSFQIVENDHFNGLFNSYYSYSGDEGLPEVLNRYLLSGEVNSVSEFSIAYGVKPELDYPGRLWFAQGLQVFYYWEPPDDQFSPMRVRDMNEVEKLRNIWKSFYNYDTALETEFYEDDYSGVP